MLFIIRSESNHDSSSGADPGLCRTCHHVRRIESDRGSIFFQCKLSFEDTRFMKYPRLPVVVCAGYRGEAAKPEGGGG